MKSRITMYINALALLLVLAIPLQLAGQRGLKYTVLHTFTGGTDGFAPTAALIEDESGNLYGTTFEGGAVGQCSFGYGCGVVFKVDPAGNYTVLHTFTQGADGENPWSDLIRDQDGNLYGTASVTESELCCGTVFKLDPTGNYTVLHVFNGVDGSHPLGGLARDESGNLYGTTAGGGNGYGVVFKLDSTGRETVLYTFTGGADGSSPYADLLRDQTGNLYGTTTSGGEGACGGEACGVIFKIDPAGNYIVLHTFTGEADGGGSYSGLYQDADGNLYGTTYYGGDVSCGCGVVFKLDPTGTETVLHAFTGGADGANPAARLVRDSQGSLYGTTNFGGSGDGQSGYGVVFKLDITGQETVLYTFTGGADGGQSIAGLVRDQNGKLYGTGNNFWGNVFKISVCSTALCLGN